MKLKQIIAMLLTVLMLLGMMPSALAQNILPGDGPIEVHKHSWGSWKWAWREGTCKEPASVLRKCKTCGAEEDGERYGDHDWGSWKTTEKATCTEKGRQERKCKICGERKTRSTDKAPHSYGAWTVITQPGEYTTGIRERKCKQCGHVQQENFYPEGTLRRGGKNDKEEVKALQEGLNDAGYDCGTPDGSFGKKTESAIKKLQEANGLNPDGVAWPGVRQLVEHQYGEWIVKVEATPFSKGMRERACQKCGHTQQEEFYPEGTLFRGDNDNEAVRAMQAGLNEAGHNCGNPDGDFGAGTERAVKSFQSANGMEADGIGWPGLQDMLGSSKAPLEGVEEAAEENVIRIVDVKAPIVERQPKYYAKLATEGFQLASGKTVRWYHNGVEMAEDERFILGDTYTVKVLVKGDVEDISQWKATVNDMDASLSMRVGIITVSCDMVCEAPEGGPFSMMNLDLSGKMAAHIAINVDQPQTGVCPDHDSDIQITCKDGTTYTGKPTAGIDVGWRHADGSELNKYYFPDEEAFMFVQPIAVTYTDGITASINGVPAEATSYLDGKAVLVSGLLDCLPGAPCKVAVTGLTPPKIGEKPDVDVEYTADPECELVSVTWYEVYGDTKMVFYRKGMEAPTFEGERTYKVKLEFVRKDGRRFLSESYTTATINGFGAEDESYSARDTLIMGMTFDKLEYPAFSIAVDAPELDKPLDFEPYIRSHPLDVNITEVKWHRMLGSGCVPGDKAEWGGYYRLYLAIETEPGNYLPMEPKVRIDFADTEDITIKRIAANKMEVYYRFPAIGGYHVVNIEDVDVPVEGETIDTTCTVATPGFKLDEKEGMYWIVNGERKQPGYVFKDGDVATVVVNVGLTTETMLTPSEAEKLAANVNHKGAEAGIGSAGNRCLEIRYTFPEIAPKKVTEIDVLFDNYEIGGIPDMEGKVLSAKAEDGTSVALTLNAISWFDISTGEYTGVDNPFEPGHQYRVSGSLKAPEGYQFTKADTKVSVNNQETSFDLGSYDNTALRFTRIFDPLTTKGELKTINRVVVALPQPTDGYVPAKSEISINAYCEDGSSGAYVLEKCAWTGKDIIKENGMLIKKNGIWSLNISLGSGDGFIFDEYAVGTVNGANAGMSVKSAGTDAEIEFEFALPIGTAMISNLNIIVDAPMADEAVDSHINVSGACTNNLYPAGFTVKSVKWRDQTAGKNLSVGDKAIGGHKYRITVEIAANSGYEFISSPVVTLNGQEALCISDESKVSVQADFYCDYAPDKAIKSVDVQIEVPENGKKASFGPKLKAWNQAGESAGSFVKLTSMRWFDLTAGIPLSQGDAFQEDHFYELTFNIATTDAEHVFTDGAKGSVNGSSPNAFRVDSGKMSIVKNYSCKTVIVDLESGGGSAGSGDIVIVAPSDPEKPEDDNDFIIGGVVVTPSETEKPDGDIVIVAPVDPETPEDGNDYIVGGVVVTPSETEKPEDSKPEVSDTPEKPDLKPEIPEIVAPEVPENTGAEQSEQTIIADTDAEPAEGEEKHLRLTIPETILDDVVLISEKDNALDLYKAQLADEISDNALKLAKDCTDEGRHQIVYIPDMDERGVYDIFAKMIEADEAELAEMTILYGLEGAQEEYELLAIMLTSGSDQPYAPCNMVDLSHEAMFDLYTNHLYSMAVQTVNDDVKHNDELLTMIAWNQDAEAEWIAAVARKR